MSADSIENFRERIALDVGEMATLTASRSLRELALDLPVPNLIFTKSNTRKYYVSYATPR
jgi:hypothetical protein